MIPKKNTKAKMESALARNQARKYILRLYISGMTPKSTKAIENLHHICEEHLKGCCELEIIDIYQHPEKARSEQIVVAPTLIKKLPVPLRKFIGDLSNTEKILVGLELKETAQNINLKKPE